MGDDIELPDRHGVRTPMPWSDAPQAGFSDHPAPYLPLVEHEVGGWRAANVAAQEADPDSLLHWVRRLVRTRKALPALGAGAFAVVDAGDDRLCVFQHVVPGPAGCAVVAVHNLSSETVTARLGLPGAGPWRRVLARGAMGPDGVDGVTLPLWLGPHGYVWWAS
jgi:maltose alpha-D-glucosyltransferase / alpha-amylase